MTVRQQFRATAQANKDNAQALLMMISALLNESPVTAIERAADSARLVGVTFEGDNADEQKFQLAQAAFRRLMGDGK